MEGRRRLRLAGLVLVGGILGYLIGPPIVHAATDLVTIKGAGSTNRARVDSTGRLQVNTEASTTSVGQRSLLTVPGGVQVLKRGGATTTAPGPGVVTAVVVDVRPKASEPVRILIDTSTGFVWRGIVKPGEHLSDTFGGGVFYEGTLRITVTGKGAKFAVYGYRP